MTEPMDAYMVTKEECQKKCDGKVCQTCGADIMPLKTVDNARNPTYWGGCDLCLRFDLGTTPKVYALARSLHEDFRNIGMVTLCQIISRLEKINERADGRPG